MVLDVSQLLLKNNKAYLLQFQVFYLFLQLSHGNQLDEFPHAGEEDESGATHQSREKHDGEDVLSHFFTQYIFLSLQTQTSLFNLLFTPGKLPIRTKLRGTYIQVIFIFENKSSPKKLNRPKNHRHFSGQNLEEPVVIDI